MTYRIKLDNCCCEPEIKMEFTFDKKHFAEVAVIANCGFRQVMITDADTGEVIYSRYVCDEHFELDNGYQNIADCIKDLLCYAKYPRGF